MLNSSIGYAVGTLNDPVAGDSLIGFAVGSLYDSSVNGDSLIGYTSATLLNPHHPMGTWNGTSVVWTPIATWDGSDLV